MTQPVAADLRAAGFETIVFDLDGTLIDSLPDVAEAMNRMLAADGRRPITLDEARQMIGSGAAVLVERAFAATGAALEPSRAAALTRDYTAAYEATPVILTAPYDGVATMLETLRRAGLRLGICTNKPEAVAREVLARLALDRFFEALVGPERVAARKPDPRHLLATIEALDAAPQSSVYVGDSPIDIACARAACVPVIGAAYGYGGVAPAALGADVVIRRFADLGDALFRLASKLVRVEDGR
jgi:phosphoglycolate phosphatase